MARNRRGGEGWHRHSRHFRLERYTCTAVSKTSLVKEIQLTLFKLLKRHMKIELADLDQQNDKENGQRGGASPKEGAAQASLAAPEPEDAQEEAAEGDLDAHGESEDGRHNDAQRLLNIERAETLSCPARHGKDGSAHTQQASAGHPQSSPFPA